MRTVMTLEERMRQSKNPERPRRRWKRWLGLLLLMALITGTVWAVRPDPHLSRVQELQKELAKGNTLTAEERKAKFTELRSEMKHLTDDQKWELAAPQREKQKAEMDRYFAMAPQEKAKYLDAKIDFSEKMRQDWEKKAGPAGKVGPSQAGGPGGGKGKQSSEAIEKSRKQFLERTSADDRAKMDVFRKEMNDRRLQRGLPMRPRT